MKYSALVLFFLMMFFAVTQTSFAQGIYGSMNDVSVSVYPQNPKPNSGVSMQIVSYLIDLGSSDITWSLDNRQVQSGVGLTTFHFTAKDIGQSTTVGLVIQPVGGAMITKNMTITPSSVDILWEAVDSAVPPFYKGKALPIAEANLKFVALPNIQDPNGALIQDDIIYSWKNNSTIDKRASGYGQDTYFLNMSILDVGANVGVTTEIRGGGLSAENSINVKITKPKLVWYLTSPLFGPRFETAINEGYDVLSNDVSVFAQPYYASPKDITSNDLTYVWKLNKSSLDAQTPSNVLSLHRDSSNGGDAVVNLVISSAKKFLLDIKSSLILHLQ